MTEYIGPYDDPDRYELDELRSRGGEGELWRASITIDGKPLPVAVKILHPADAGNVEEASHRWRNQAELLRTLEHPSLVKVREVFEGPGPHSVGNADPEQRSLYLVMNWADGESLPAWVSQHGDRDVLDVTRVVTRIASAIDYLHSGKATGGTPVLHRDIKPANVIVDGADVRVVDFGFARLDGDHVTFAGTPAYLAPEVVAGAQPTVASDRYGVGATAYFAFTGEDPTSNDAGAMRAKLTQVSGLEGREDIADHLLAMMARDPARRPTNIVEWAQTLAVGTVSDRIRAAQSTPDPGEATLVPTSRRRRRRWIVAGLGGLAVVAIIAGAAVALSGGGDGGSGQASETSADDGSEPVAATTVRMPDVVGMDLADARRVLRDDDIRDITVEQRDSAEPEGTVLEQSPRPGAVVRDSDTVTLTVAREVTTMPDVVGKRVSEATNELEALGITVIIVDVLDEDESDGTVIGQDPRAGGPLPDEVSLQVARQPVGIYLMDLIPVDGDYNREFGSASVSGDVYARSVILGAGYSAPRELQYDLGRNFQRFVVTIGLRDDSPSDSQVLIEISGDGRPLFSQTVGLGTAVVVDLDVTEILRLELSATLVEGGTGRTAATAVFGDARLLGTRDSVPASPTTTLG